MAIESRFRTRGGYSHVTPYNRQNRGVLARKPPAPPTTRARSSGAAASYAFVASQRTSLGTGGAVTSMGRGHMVAPCSQQQPAMKTLQQCGTGGVPYNSDTNMAFVAMPMTLPPPICAQTRLPQFDRLYEEFEKMKRGGFVIQPQPQPQLPPPPSTLSMELQVPPPPTQQSVQRIPSPTPSAGSCASSSGGDQPEQGVFATAMKLFMHSYMPTACFDCATPVDDWGREAQALLAEVMAPGQVDERSTKSTWPHSSSSRNTSSDYDVSISGSSSPDKTCGIGVGLGPVCNPMWVSGTQQQHKMDIHRHILEIKPSPYPGGSPLSLPSVISNHSSDNDADDESVASSTSSPASIVPRAPGNTTVRRPSYKKKHDSARIRLSMDSGYQSSSTDGGSSCHGSQAPAGGLDSDGFSSDIGSTCSSRPSSPTRDTGFLSPTDLPPYLNALLEAPWIRNASSNAQSRTAVQRDAPIPTVASVGENTSIPIQSQPSSGAEGSTYTYHKHKDWITDEILEMIVVRDRLYKRMKKHPAPDIVDMYKKVRNMVVGMTRNAKRAHEKKLEDEAARSRMSGYHNMGRSRPRRSSSSYHRPR
uniref:Uncharacterized protein LOC100183225 n=1 Tax=Phallusia mammillata TaxID=59560 RepID=A0A6F9DIC2_9ASCI|nr:uncharacterized protein LOC100183225 [Phallusia mammillata]